MKNKGFTLIELLLVSAMTAIVAAMSVSFFTALNNSRNLQKATGDLTEILTQAKSYSLSQVISSCVSGTDPLASYDVTTNPSGKTNCFVLEEVCQSGAKHTTVIRCLPKGVTFNSSSSTVFSFLVQTSTASARQIILDSPNSGSKTIKVDSQGIISTQ